MNINHPNLYKKTLKKPTVLYESNENINEFCQPISNIFKGFILRKFLLTVDKESDEINENEIFIYDETIDIPSKVTETYKNDKGKLFLKVQFKERSNGINPNEKVFSSEYLRNKFPYFLIDFYESKITTK